MKHELWLNLKERPPGEQPVSRVDGPIRSRAGEPAEASL